ncbi:MAG: sodium:calcium antiporter [Candidatus Doudnabacteria bacterium]
MPEILIKFVISLSSLMVSAYFLLKFSEKLASRVKISPLIIGVTLVAIGTSLPETFVAISSILQDAPLVSFGDIIGSNIINVCLILGISILLFPVRIGTEKTQKNNLILLILVLFFSAVFFLPEGIRGTLGIMLVIFYVIFFVTEIIWGERGSKKEDKKALSKLKKNNGNPLFYFFVIVISVIGLIASSKFLVSSVISISQMFNISQEIIGLSVVAFGTSLPELAATLASAFRKDWKLLYGDVQGSNIYNLSVIGSVLIIFSKNGYSIDTFSLIYMGVVTISFIALSHKYKGTTIPRIYGLFYIIAYAFYLFKIYKL